MPSSRSRTGSSRSWSSSALSADDEEHPRHADNTGEFRTQIAKARKIDQRPGRLAAALVYLVGFIFSSWLAVHAVQAMNRMRNQDLYPEDAGILK